MSNRAFDIIDGRIDLQNAKQSLASWGCALVRTDITSEEVEFLSRALAGAKAWVRQAQAWVDRGCL